MNEHDAREAVHTAILQVAPEVDVAGLDEGSRLQQDLELDSLDFLRLVETIDEATGIDIPERDYAKVATVRSLIGYLAARG
jgi:acyl carrier protein